MGVREMDRFLEQWEMGVKDMHRRLILAPTPRERALRQALGLARRLGCWPMAGPPRRWNGTPTPLDGGWPPSAKVGPQP